MKVFLKNAITKKILIVFVTIIMVSNFIMPNYVSAANGGKLFTPITELLMGIADRIMATMEAIFVGELNASDVLGGAEIKEEAPSQYLHWNFAGYDGTVSTYNIRYSPAIIFSGKVPALDINFIEPMSEIERTFETPDYKYTRIANPNDPIYGDFTWKEVKEKYNAPSNLKVQKGDSGWLLITGNTDNYYSTWTHDGKTYYYIHNNDNNSIAESIGEEIGAWILDLVGVDEEDYWKGTLYEYQQVGTTTVTKESTAGLLQSQISKWYVALRTFALVGLLSVLVYIGIRIILSSGSAQNQAKYKNMFKDWLTAVCIIFMLHYIMAFTLDITSTITDIFEVSSIDPGGRDIFMSDVRNAITGVEDYWTYFGYVVMYIALVILTITFTIEYLKRVIFIAFLTMIAPLIALTYPIDKIKDGKAQAFSTWIKEYIFNCLVQPVHLLLYTIFIDSSYTLSAINPIFAIVALAFFRPAEKFFRKMFGFDSAQGMSTLGAAAGGAMVMNMLNKMQGKGAKGKESGAGASAGASNNPNNVRTATRNGATPIPGGNTSGNNQTGNNQTGNNQAGNNQTGNNQAGNNHTGNNQVGNNQTGNNQAGNNQTGNNQAGNSQTSNNQTTNYSISTPSRANGFKALGKKVLSSTPNALKSMGKWTARNSIKAAGALAGATVGLAAAVADGDFENPLGKVAMGAGIGAVGASGLANSITSKTKGAWNSVSETYQRGKLGDEAYNNMQLDKAAFKSEQYKMMEQDPQLLHLYGNADGIKVKTQEYFDNGITDLAEIKIAMQNGITGDEYKQYADAGVKSSRDIKAFRDNNIDIEKFKEIKTYSGETDINKMLRYNTIAKASKDEGNTTQRAFINWAKRNHSIDEEDAKKLFKQVKYYW